MKYSMKVNMIDRLQAGVFRVGQFMQYLTSLYQILGTLELLCSPTLASGRTPCARTVTVTGSCQPGKGDSNACHRASQHSRRFDELQRRVKRDRVCSLGSAEVSLNVQFQLSLRKAEEDHDKPCKVCSCSRPRPAAFSGTNVCVCVKCNNTTAALQHKILRVAEPNEFINNLPDGNWHARL